MDDINEKIMGILNNPESAAQLEEMAKNLFSAQKAQEAQESPPADMMKIMSLMNRFKKGSNSQNENLLLALKPHLSPPRQKKVDTAVKILKILEMAPMLSEIGLLDNLL